MIGQLYINNNDNNITDDYCYSNYIYSNYNHNCMFIVFNNNILIKFRSRACLCVFCGVTSFIIHLVCHAPPISLNCLFVMRSNCQPVKTAVLYNVCCGSGGALSSLKKEYEFWFGLKDYIFLSEIQHYNLGMWNLKDVDLTGQGWSKKRCHWVNK